jgi:phenylalanyl-tRNA synthetase beta chain
MPVIDLNRNRFARFLGKDLSTNEMTDKLPWLGLDIEGVDAESVKIEYNPNRADFCSYTGIARALQGIMNIKTGLIDYKVVPSGLSFKVDSSVENVRPIILCSVVKHLIIDEDVVAELMTMQDDLTWSIGRDRKKAAIGIHDLDKTHGPFKYLGCGPDDLRFVPLGKTEEMTPRQVLEKHEKGIAYGHLVAGLKRYPVILDGDGGIISFPPVINSEQTRVTGDTRNLLIDVTGYEMGPVSSALNILITALSDMGGKLQSIIMEYPDKTTISPDLSPRHITFRPEYGRKLLGLKLSDERVAEALERCRMKVHRKDHTFDVEIPVYRVDIMHEVDLVEELALGYGFYKITPTLPKTLGIGEPHPLVELAREGRTIMVGHGYVEMMNLILTNDDIHYHRMRMRNGDAVRLLNPVSADFSIMRTSLLPGLMKNLMDNTHESYPQKIFESSDIILRQPDSSVKTRRVLHLAGVSSHAEASFTEARSVMESVLQNLDLEGWSVIEDNQPFFIEGRAAKFVFGDLELGIAGEIHPEVLTNFLLENPVAAFEMDLELANTHRKKRYL